MKSKIISAGSFAAILILIFSIFGSFQGISNSGAISTFSPISSTNTYLNTTNEKTGSFNLQFNETGLPAGKIWSLYLKGTETLFQSSGSSNIFFLVTAGNFSITIYVPNGYEISSLITKSYSITDQANANGGGKNISEGYVNVSSQTFINLNIKAVNNGSGTVIAVSIILSLIAVLVVIYYYTKYSKQSKGNSK
ncbi:MAG: hypothetical protein ACYDAO_09655 [Thermoplasmataceae archaeon]